MRIGYARVSTDDQTLDLQRLPVSLSLRMTGWNVVGAVLKSSPARPGRKEFYRAGKLRQREVSAVITFEDGSGQWQLRFISHQRIGLKAAPEASVAICYSNSVHGRVRR